MNEDSVYTALKFASRPGYEHKGPFTFVRNNPESPSSSMLVRHLTVRDAFEMFVARSIEPVGGIATFIKDVDGVCVIGYGPHRGTIGWAGTNFGVDMLATFDHMVHPLILADAAMCIEEAYQTGGVKWANLV